MGKPRDENVYRHAHESKLMYVPLAVLAVGTLLASYFLFRPLIADAATAATAAPLVLALDGHEYTAAIGAAHRFLTFGVGGAFIIAFLAAIAIYRRGLETPERIRRALAPLPFVLGPKSFFYEVYDVI